MLTHSNPSEKPNIENKRGSFLKLSDVSIELTFHMSVQ
jgi:hypothetical protein